MEGGFSQVLFEALKKNHTKQYSNEDIKLLEKLGQGASGEVYKAEIVNTNEFVAIKLLTSLDGKQD